MNNISLKQPVHFKGFAFNRKTTDAEDRVILDKWSNAFSNPKLASKARVSERGWIYIKESRLSPEMKVFVNRLPSGGCYINLNGCEMSDNFSCGNKPLEQVGKSNVNLLKAVVDKAVEFRSALQQEAEKTPGQIRDFIEQCLPPKI